MFGTLGIVQVNDCSAMAHAKRQFAGGSLLQWVVRRVTDSQRLDGVIALMPAGAEYRAFSRWVPSDVPVHLSDRPDWLGRYADALREYPAQGVVRIVVNHPAIDAELVDQLVTSAGCHSECDYIGYRSAGVSAMNSPLELFPEWFRARALRQVEASVTDAAARQQVTAHLYGHPETYNVRLLPTPKELDRPDVRLMVDGEEDWENWQTILDALGPDRLDCRNLGRLLDQHPGLRERMLALNEGRAALADTQ